ncbi:hypothetical protein GTQ40_10485 [Flavobacteriaceae bacterium R38]|nr:hypothetical protein [Flavobacteriaceae bacterium R38]
MGTSASWNKSNAYDFVLKDRDGNVLNNVKDLVYLRTDTLTVLDKDSRTVFMLADFKNASVGSEGKAVTLIENIGRSFYVTNPYSFSLYIDDKHYKGKITNVNGSYVCYVESLDATYYLDGIRKFDNWGAKSVYKMKTAPKNTYWYRAGNEYAVVEKGKTIDYSNASTRKEGDDLIVNIEGVKKYTLEGYYNASDYVVKPVKYHDSPSVSGCVSGDCNNGWGKWQYANGHYDGFWQNGKKNGYGLYQWKGKGKYIGNWKEDTMSDYGVYIAENNDNIIGEYKNGQLNGLGITVKGEKWSQGIYNDGNLTTPYTFVSTNNKTGCTAGDCQNKYGRMVWDNGDTFTGFFKDGNMYMGTYSFASGDKYSGMFNSQNQFHGTGRFFFKNGEYYGGNWKNGKYSGKGYYHNSKLVQQIGEWSDGKLIKAMK